MHRPTFSSPFIFFFAAFRGESELLADYGRPAQSISRVSLDGSGPWSGGIWSAWDQGFQPEAAEFARSSF